MRNGNRHLVPDHVRPRARACFSYKWAVTRSRLPNGEALHHWDIVIGGRDTGYFES